jgi:hypothetical protein
MDFRRNTPAILVTDRSGEKVSILFAIGLKNRNQTLEDLSLLLGQLMETGEEVCAMGNRLFLPNGQVLTNVHDEKSCEGRGCSIHHPSLHHMSNLSQVYNHDRMLMMRECSHGVRHPDPDDKDLHLSVNDGFDLSHGCCRYQCCENRLSKAKKE